MLDPYLIVVGHGAFAKVFIDKFEAFTEQAFSKKIQTVVWESKETFEISRDSMVLHAGSGRQLFEVIDYCQKNKIPLIQASSGQTPTLPELLSFPFLDAPNLSLPIIKLLALLESWPDLFRDFDIQVRESHQKSKTTVPSTAREFARFLGIGDDQIVSIRDPAIQKTELEVPDEYLDGHAVHQVVISGQGAEVSFASKVYGRDTYLYGVFELFRIREKLKPGRYSLFDLVSKGLI